MEGFDSTTSFGYETSKRYDALETRGDEAHAGVRVDGIELSQNMVDRMREKPGGESRPGTSHKTGCSFSKCRVPTAPRRPGWQYVEAERVAVDEVTLGSRARLRPVGHNFPLGAPCASSGHPRTYAGH